MILLLKNSQSTKKFLNMSSKGYYGTSYDRYQAHNEHSTLHRMKETYWTTKQAVIKKLGKKEDEHIVASDSQLDAKLEVFHAIQASCMDLLRAIEKYQDRLCALSQSENGMGRFLKSECQHDKTRAGKMMAAVGKAQSFSSQQRLALRVPLVRLYQEVETFRYRAISDTLITVNRMESARTEYRGALLWMKDVSEELDPDTYKQLEKFRKVQAQVKKTKAKFDKLKLDTMQKIDLLAASRCNMFSHVLANYQTTLLHFWAKTSRTMSAVAESFKGYQYYEFNMLKELAEPTKKLAEETGSKDEPDKDINRRLDRDGTGDGLKADHGSLTNLLEAVDSELSKTASAPSARRGSDEGDPFIDFGEEADEMEALDDLDEIKRKQDAEFDMSGKTIPSASHGGPAPGQTGDLLTDELLVDENKDDIALLNEILNAPPATGEDDFSREWQAVFGATPLSTGQSLTPVEPDQPDTADFMPSNLLDLSRQMAAIEGGQGPVAAPALMAMQPGGSAAGPPGPPGGATPQQRAAAVGPSGTPGEKQAKGKGKKGDMSAWFNLFADLDPLSDPDAVGKKNDEMSGAL